MKMHATRSLKGTPKFERSSNARKKVEMAQFCISPTPSWTALMIARGLLAIGTTKTIRPLSPFIKLQASYCLTGRSCRHWINAELLFAGAGEFTRVRFTGLDSRVRF